MVILTGIYPPDSGGPATFAVSFSDFLGKSNCTSKVLSFTDSDNVTLNDKHLVVKLISRKHSLGNRSLKAITEIFLEFLRKSDVIANGLFIETYLASILIRGKYVAKVPGDIVWERATNSGITKSDVLSFQNEKVNLKYKFFRFLFTRSLVRAKAVIVPSPVLHQLCLSWGVPESKIHKIFNSVDVNYFHPATNSVIKYDCVVVNRLVKLKNVDQVIRACQARNLSLLVVGDGPEMGNLVSLSTDLQAKTFFAGNVPQSELVNYLQSSNIYILNSTVDATAYSLLESRSCGLICIANIETGASEVIKHKIDGYLTETTNSVDIELAFDWISSRSSHELAVMREMSRQSTLDNFNKDKNFARILEIVVG